MRALIDIDIADCLDIAARILKLIQPTTTTMTTIIGANPFAQKTDAELDTEIKKRLSFSESSNG